MSVFSIKLDIIILVPLALELLGLWLAVYSNPELNKTNRHSLYAIIVLSAALITQDFVGYSMDSGGGGSPEIRTIVAIIGYVIRPVIILIYIYILSDKETVKTGLILVVMNTLIHLTALFSGICFSIDENNVFHRGPLGFTCHVISFILLAQLTAVTIKYYSKDEKLKVFIPFLNTALIVLSVIADELTDYREMPVSFLTIAIVSTSVFSYIWIYYQFVKQHEEAMQAEKRIQIMMSQIQPHFLYNTLSTIQALCSIDPEEAADVTEKFGSYLRQNLDSLNKTELIPIEKELEHTKTYAEIEAVRFPDIKVEYEIDDEEFLVPALTVQPLVENAIRHGVRGMKDGRVSVITERENGVHVITVKDNGRGFDPGTLETGDDPHHIGIRNVKERVEKMSHGRMTVESAKGEGTEIKIYVPEEVEEVVS